MPSTGPAFVFDLDGTLVDSVYQHVLAFREVFEEAGIHIPFWRIHRRIGMSGGLVAQAVAREAGRPVSRDEADRIAKRHGEVFRENFPDVSPLPGACELLRHLTEEGLKVAIATSGRLEDARPALDRLALDRRVAIITRDKVQRAKPDPDIFVAAAEELGVRIEDALIIGDSIWDLLAAGRARALGIGLLTGGYSQDELERAGAYRVYRDPADLLDHLDEVGVRSGG
jgi:HAD superfamily hydrolase (TIGR01509 family)